MTVRNTVVNNEQTNITFTQDTNLGVGSDKRRWSAEKDGDRYVFWIGDDFKIYKQVNDGAPISTAVLSGANLGYAITIDKTLTYLYLLIKIGAGSSTIRVTVSDMTNETLGSLGSAVPLKAQITPNGDKIVWLGSNNTLYKMDLNGGNLESVFFGSNISSFTTAYNKAWAIVGAQILSINLGESPMSVTAEADVGVGVSKIIINSFTLGENIFFSVWGNIDLKARICKYNVLTKSYQDVDITTLNGVQNNKTKKFNLAYDGSNHYGILCENNGADRKYMWKVDLDTLALQGLREVSKVNNSGIKTLTSQFADTGTMATIDTDGANDDWTGCDRVTVFS